MSEQWINAANDEGELSETLIQSLIKTAAEQLKFSYTPTNCAERTAFFKAVSEGVHDFRAICIVGGMNGVWSSYAAPCGVCRQVMMEFCDPETFRIILAASDGKYKIYRLKELLPEGFGPDNLE